MPITAPTQYRRDKILTKRQDYERLKASLYNERTTYEQHWRELGDYIRPRRTRFLVSEKNKGDRRSKQIIDSTATFAARTLQSGLHAGVTSPARPWMRLVVPDPDLAKSGPVNEWLHTVTERMLTVFSLSNIYNMLPVLYGDFSTFGTGAAAVLEDDVDLMRCYNYPIGSYWLGCSARQIVDTCVREYTLTVRQVIEQFAWDRNTNLIDWTNISTTIKNLWDRGDSEADVKICWIVRPNIEANGYGLDAKNMPFTSCYFEVGQNREDQFLRESGFEEFPIMAPRWEVEGEDIYGTTCPGMTALPDVRQLQTMVKRKGQAVELQVNPSLQAPTHLQNSVVSMLPGGMTWYDQREGQVGIKPIREVHASVADLTADINETRFMIRRAFFEDLFLMMASTDRREITAREVSERHEEKLLALGPVLERMNDELLDPLIDRTYGMMDRAGLIPPPPPELEGVELEPKYISIMHEAMRLVGAASLERMLGTVVPLAATFPEIKHKINAFQVVDDLGAIFGINPKIIVPDDEAAAALEQERKAQAAAAQAQAMESMSKSAGNLAGADMSGDNALTRISQPQQQ